MPSNRQGAALLLLCLVLGSILIPWLSPFPYDQINLAMKNQAPNITHWFGTDELGRDLFVRVWMGGRLSLSIACLAALLDLCVGVLWGATASLSGGWIEETMMRLIDFLYALPQTLVVIALVAVVGTGIGSLVLAIAAFGWITMARIARGLVAKILDEPYITSAKLMGCSFPRILFIHVLPNAAPQLTVSLLLTVSSAIFTESFLSFLGLGVQAPLASWGSMLHEGLPALFYYPWRILFPGMMLTLALLCLSLLSRNTSYAASEVQG